MIVSVGAPIVRDNNLLGSLIGANFNSTGDQAIALIPGIKNITRMLVTNWSGTSAVAVGGFYSATSKGGNVLVSAGTVYTSAASGITIAPTIAKSHITGSNLYLSLTVAEGGALTADIYVFGDTLS